MFSKQGLQITKSIYTCKLLIMLNMLTSGMNRKNIKSRLTLNNSDIGDVFSNERLIRVVLGLIVMNVSFVNNLHSIYLIVDVIIYLWLLQKIWYIYYITLPSCILREIHNIRLSHLFFIQGNTSLRWIVKNEILFA